MFFAEFEACVAAGLDLYRWWNHQYDKEFQEHVVAWHSLHNEIETHANDAVQRKMDREQRRAKRKK